MHSKNCDNKLFLLDAMALIYRAYFAFINAPRINSKGLNTSAMFGMTNTILEILEKEKPSHIAVCFDTSAPTERHVEFEAYKANRQEMPEDLAKSIPYVYQLFEAFNIPTVVLDGYEADDIVGTLAKQAEKECYTVYMMTPDKDYAQLVSENIFMYKPGRKGGDTEILGVQEVLQKYELSNVDQVRDLLGLMGDSSDNIPGVAGVGEKTAKTLIAQFGSVENMLENTDKISGKLREKVESSREIALLSKKLATINCQVPVNINLDDLKVSEINKEAIVKLFTELEFRALSRRVLGEELTISAELKSTNGQIDMFSISTEVSIDTEPAPGVEYKTIHNTEHDYKVLDSAEACKALAKQLEGQKFFCFDTETTSTDAIQAELVGLSFSFKPGEAYYVPLPAEKEKVLPILEIFKNAFAAEGIEKIGQNIKYDLIVLKNYGVEVKGKLSDTMLAHYLIDPDSRHGMDLMAQSLLQYNPVSITELIGKKGKNQGSMRDVAIEQIAEYAAEDADITLQLHHKLAPMLLQREAHTLAADLENPLIYVLADMEREGVALDVDFLNLYSKQLQNEIAATEEQVYSLCGTKFNIASPKQLGEVLFEKLRLDEKAKKTKTGQYQTGEDILLGLAHKHDVVKHILDYRQGAKLKSTYVDALPAIVNPFTQRVHTSYNQAVAATGRLSSNNPNLQNIPIRTDKGKEVRKAFIARNDDHVLISADYSQIELRIIAEISGDEGMLEAFSQNLDIHKATAAKVYGLALEDVDQNQRRNAKAVNFGIIYGQSAFGLAQNLGISRKEASEIISAYFEKYPNIKSYMTDTISFARSHGYVQTLMGRRRYLRDINSANATVRGFAERNAINAPIQGSAADMIKVAMIRIHKALQEGNFATKMILQVHDELVFDAPKSEVEKVSALIKTLMQDAIPLKVPIIVEAGTGINWLHAH